MQRLVACFEYPCNLCISSITLVPTFTWVRFFLGADFLHLPANGPWTLEGAGIFGTQGVCLVLSHTCGMITYFNLWPCKSYFPAFWFTDQSEARWIFCLYCSNFNTLFAWWMTGLKENIFIVTDLTNQKPGGFGSYCSNCHAWFAQWLMAWKKTSL